MSATIAALFIFDIQGWVITIKVQVSCLLELTDPMPASYRSPIVANNHLQRKLNIMDYLGNLLNYNLSPEARQYEKSTSLCRKGYRGSS